MTTTAKPSAISGVSANRESILTTVYPSIASTAVGRSLGKIYDSIPLRIMGIKLSHLLFVLPTAPLALAAYFALKLMGKKYVLTNRSVQIWAAFGNRQLEQVALADIDDVVIDQQPGQQFYPAADLYLVNKAGAAILVLEGVSRAEVLRQNLIEARNAQRSVAASLATINARHAGTRA